MIASLRKRRAINTFVRKLGPALERRFGRKRHYSPKEVRRGGRDIGAPVGGDFCYAYSIYCSREDFDEHHREAGEHCDYDSMRAEVANLQFGGDTSFDAGTAIDHAASHHDSTGGSHDSGGGWFGWGGSDSDGGGDSGGGDGGGGD